MNFGFMTPRGIGKLLPKVLDFYLDNTYINDTKIDHRRKRIWPNFCIIPNSLKQGRICEVVGMGYMLTW